MLTNIVNILTTSTPGPLRGGWVLTHFGGSKLFQRKSTKKCDFTLPLHDPRPPGTIKYLEEKFLCKNGLKVTFTLSLLTLGEPPWNFRKKFRRETRKNRGFSKINFDPPHHPLDPPWGTEPTVPIYDTLALSDKRNDGTGRKLKGVWIFGIG